MRSPMDDVNSIYIIW